MESLNSQPSQNLKETVLKVEPKDDDYLTTSIEPDRVTARPMSKTDAGNISAERVDSEQLHAEKIGSKRKRDFREDGNSCEKLDSREKLSCEKRDSSEKGDSREKMSCEKRNSHEKHDSPEKLDSRENHHHSENESSETEINDFHSDFGEENEETSQTEKSLDNELTDDYLDTDSESNEEWIKSQKHPRRKPKGKKKRIIATNTTSTNTRRTQTRNGNVNQSTNKKLSAEAKIYPCHTCGKTFDLLRLLKQHRLSVHEDDVLRPHSCQFCNKTFKRSCHLKEHMYNHTQERSHCDMCERSFLSPGLLKRHQKVHLNDKQYECLLCHKTFTRKDLLQKHEIIHTGRHDCLCDICGKSFAQKESLLLHRRIHVGHRPHACEICYRTFTQSCHLKQHMICHSQDKPFVCALCSMAFSRAESLKKHERWHEKEKEKEAQLELEMELNPEATRKKLLQKKHVCNVCKKAFIRVGHLEHHMYTHTKQKNHVCGVCSKAYTRFYTLKRHMRLHEEEEQNELSVNGNVLAGLHGSDHFQPSGFQPNHLQSNSQSHLQFDSHQTNSHLQSDSDLRTHSNLQVDSRVHASSAQGSHLNQSQHDSSAHQSVSSCGNSAADYSASGNLASVDQQHLRQPVFPSGNQRHHASTSETGRGSASGNPLQPVSAAANHFQHSGVDRSTEARDYRLVNQAYQSALNSLASASQKPEQFSNSSINFTKVDSRPVFPSRNFRSTGDSDDNDDDADVSLDDDDGDSDYHVAAKDYGGDRLESKAVMKNGARVTSRHRDASPNDDEDVDDVVVKFKVEPADVETQENHSENFAPTSSSSSTVPTYLTHLPTAGPVSIMKNTGHKQHSKPSFTCELCDRTFVRPGQLRKHWLLHSSVETQFRCEGEDCNKSFLTSEELDKHRGDGDGGGGGGGGGDSSSIGGRGKLEHKHKGEGRGQSNNEGNDVIQGIGNDEGHVNKGRGHRRGNDVNDGNDDDSRNNGGDDSNNSNSNCDKTGASDDSGTRRFACSFCDSKFHLPCELERHESGHSEYKNSEKRMDKNSKFSDKSSVTKRKFVPVEYKDSDEEKEDLNLMCDLCGTLFKRVGDLNRHCKVHDDYRPHQCEVCLKKFNRASHLKEHVLIHFKRKTHLCAVCGSGFISAGTLKKHEVVHTGMKPYKCDVCQKAFARKSDVNEHKLIHSGQKNHVCEVCSKAFYSGSNLRQHRLTHKDKRPHACDLCDKSYSTNSHLQTHMLTHSDARPYVCNVCSKGFRLSCHLREHMLIHSGEKKHVCEICGKAFGRASHKNRHMLLHAKLSGKSDLTANAETFSA